MEIPLEHLLISQLDPSSALFGIIRKHTFIKLPIIIQQIEICVIETTFQNHGVIVVYLTVAMELVVCPVALVGELTALVVQFTPPVHLVTFPLAIVVAAVLVEKFATTMPQPILLEPLVLAPSLILLNNKLDLRIILVFWFLALVRCLFINLHNSRVIFIGVSVSGGWGYLHCGGRFWDILGFGGGDQMSGFQFWGFYFAYGLRVCLSWDWRSCSCCIGHVVDTVGVCYGWNWNWQRRGHHFYWLLWFDRLLLYLVGNLSGYSERYASWRESITITFARKLSLP